MHEGHDMSDLHGASCCCPACAARTSTSTTPSPTRVSRQLHKTIEAAELAEKAGYSRPHTLHCGPDGVFLTCLGAGNGDDGPGRHRAARPHHVRRAAGLGDRPRAAVPGLRRLVAPAAEHAGHQRVGHPVDDRGRRSSPSCCSATSTATRSTSGTSRPAHSRRSTSARSTRWRWSCAPPTTRRPPGASSAW